MPPLNLTQQASVFTLQEYGYDGADVSANMMTALIQICNEIDNPNTGNPLMLGRALDILDGFSKEQLIATASGTPLVPSSTSTDPTLAFIGRLTEIYTTIIAQAQQV